MGNMRCKRQTVTDASLFTISNLHGVGDMTKFNKEITKCHMKIDYGMLLVRRMKCTFAERETPPSELITRSVTRLSPQVAFDATIIIINGLRLHCIRGVDQCMICGSDEVSSDSPGLWSSNESNVGDAQ